MDSPRSFGHTHHTYYNIACVYAHITSMGLRDSMLLLLDMVRDARARGLDVTTEWPSVRGGDDRYPGGDL